MSTREISIKIYTTKVVRRVLIAVVVGGCSQRSEKWLVCPEEPWQGRHGAENFHGIFKMENRTVQPLTPHPTSWPPRAKQPLKGKPCWPFYHHVWILPLTGFHIRGIIHQVCLVPDIHSSSMLLDEWKLVPFCSCRYSTVWTYHHLLTHFPVDGHSDWFQFGTCMNKAAVLVHVFLWHDVSISLG